MNDRRIPHGKVFGLGIVTLFAVLMLHNPAVADSPCIKDQDHAGQAKLSNRISDFLGTEVTINCEAPLGKIERRGIKGKVTLDEERHFIKKWFVLKNPLGIQAVFEFPDNYGFPVYFLAQSNIPQKIMQPTAFTMKGTGNMEFYHRGYSNISLFIPEKNLEYGGHFYNGFLISMPDKDGPQTVNVGAKLAENARNILLKNLNELAKTNGVFTVSNPRGYGSEDPQTMVVFFDIRCRYCKKLANNFDDLTKSGYQFIIVPYDRTVNAIGNRSTRTTEAFACGNIDRAALLAMVNGKLRAPSCPREDPRKAAAVEASKAFFDFNYNLPGTPTLIHLDTMSPHAGYQPEKWPKRK